MSRWDQLREATGIRVPLRHDPKPVDIMPTQPATPPPPAGGGLTVHAPITGKDVRTLASAINALADAINRHAGQSPVPSPPPDRSWIDMERN